MTAVWSSWLQDGDSTVLSVTFRVLIDWIQDAVGTQKFAGECSSKAAQHTKQMNWLTGIYYGT